MPDLPNYPSISDPAEFQAWIKAFKGKTGWVCPSKAPKSDAKKRPISETLQSIANNIAPQRGSAATLELNLLYACFLTSRAPAPEQDVCAETRRELATEQADRPKALRALQELQNYLEAQRPTALRAMAQTDDPAVKVSSHATALSAQRLDAMRALLSDFEHGLFEFNVNSDHYALISSSDFCYGPFEFDFDLNTTWKKKGTSSDDGGMNVIHTGLMFHLSYLFRYFTCETLPKTAAFFRNDILVLDGVRMISVGEPHGAYVAALTNVVFGEKYSSRDVKDRLDALYAPTPGSTTAKNPIFIGW